MDEIKRSVAKVLIDELKLTPDDDFVFMHDTPSVKIAVPVMELVKSINCKKYIRYCLDSYIEINDGKTRLKLPPEIERSLETATASFFLTTTIRDGELRYFREPMMKLIRSRPDLRHAHAPETSETAFLQGTVVVDYTKTKI